MRVVRSAGIPRDTTSGSSPPYSAALDPRTTARCGRFCCGQTGGRWHASRARVICDEHISTRIVKLVFVEFPPPHKCVDSELEIIWQRKSATTHGLVHATAHFVSIDIAIREGLLEPGVLLHPICLGSDVREVITRTRAFADEQLHASLFANISMVFGWPLPNKLLPRSNLCHGIDVCVPTFYSITAPLLVGVTDQTLWHIFAWPYVTADICRKRD